MILVYLCNDLHSVILIISATSTWIGTVLCVPFQNVFVFKEFTMNHWVLLTIFSVQPRVANHSRVAYNGWLTDMGCQVTIQSCCEPFWGVLFWRVSCSLYVKESLRGFRVKMGATSRTRTAYPSRAPDFNPEC